MKKITNNEYYNAYEYNNSGMFVCLTQYCVGESDYVDELTFGVHRDIAISVANRLNKRKIKEWEKIKNEYYKCPRCHRWKLEKKYMDRNGFDICDNCSEYVEHKEVVDAKE